MKPKYLRFVCMAAIAGVVALSAALPASAAAPALSRGEVFKLIADQLKLAPKNAETALPSDVTADSPYANAVRILKERKILEGYPDGTFKPDQPITSREFGYVLGRFLGIDDSKSADKMAADFGVKIGDAGAITGEQAAAAIEAALKNDEKARQLVRESGAKQNDLKSFRTHTKSKTSFSLKENGNLPMPDSEATIDQDIHMEKGIHQIAKTMVGQEMIAIEQYIVPEGMFMKMKDPASGQEKWFNMGKETPLHFDQLIKLQKQNVTLNSKLAGDTIFYRDLGKDAKGLHGIKVQGRLEAADIQKMLAEVLGQEPGFSESLNTPEINGMSMSINGVMWLSEDTKIPARLQYEMTIRFGDSKDMPFSSMNMSMESEFSDFDKIPEIVLPAEVKNAPELSSMMGAKPLAK